MVFRRRDRLPFPARMKALVYPKGGWRRAGQYLWLRLTRLPDPPHRIARGVFAGVFVSFTPFFGIHLGLGAALGFILRGNIVAAMLATLFGNPLTFPPIALVSMQLGNWLMGHPAGQLTPGHILTAFAGASAELWANFTAIFSSAPTHWGKLFDFYDNYFAPYLLGGSILGIVTGIACYYASLALVAAYKRMRERRRQERYEQGVASRAGAARLHHESASLREAPHSEGDGGGQVH